MLRHRFVEKPGDVGCLGGFCEPRKAAALYLEGYGLCGGVIDPGGFAGGGPDACLAIGEVGAVEALFGQMRAFLRSPQGTAEANTYENEMAIGLWHLPGGRALLLAADAGGSDCLSARLAEAAGLAKVTTFSAAHFCPLRLRREAAQIAAECAELLAA